MIFNAWFAEASAFAARGAMEYKSHRASCQRPPLSQELMAALKLMTSGSKAMQRISSQKTFKASLI